MNSIKIRQAAEEDVNRITHLFFDTIQNINIKDYSKEEVDDWSSWKSDIEKWLKKMQEQYFIVAEINNNIVGFSSLTQNGYLDFMFVDKDIQGQGVASALLSEIERKAIEQKNDFIYSDVSLTARGFFENKGFVVERQQLKKSKKKELINFRMKKINSNVRLVIKSFTSGQFCLDYAAVDRATLIGERTIWLNRHTNLF